MGTSTLYKNMTNNVTMQVQRGSKMERRLKAQGWLCMSKSIDERKANFDNITIEDLTTVDGIGDSTAKKLIAAGICSIADMLTYSVKEIANKTGMKLGKVENFYETAKHMIGECDDCHL